MDKTITEIAHITGFSIGTVSKVLNDRPGISITTKKKIRAVAKELNYFPFCKSRTRGLSRSLQKYIGVLTSPFEYSIRQAIEDSIDYTFKSYGYHIIKLIFTMKESRIVDLDLFYKNVVENKDIAGLISITLPLTDKIVSELHKNRIPVVIVGLNKLGADLFHN